MKVAVVGTGTMGMGIAQVFATHGDEVAMCIVTGKDPEGKRARFNKGIQRLADKGKITQERCDEICGKVSFGPMELAKDADLVVESALEEMDAKIEVFEKLDAICKPETIFTTNTSSLSITEIMSRISRPLVGMHFFNPAPVMKLVEVIPGILTPQDLVDKIVKIPAFLARSIRVRLASKHSGERAGRMPVRWMASHSSRGRPSTSCGLRVEAAEPRR